MATAQAGVLRHIRELVAAEQTDRLPDHELLERFIAAHQEAAFAALVRRHGPLVLGVCRRVLGNAADAEDAFQAAFLVLARKATTIRKRESLSGWLARVAYHTALRARRQAAVRRQHEQQAVQRSQADPFAELTGRELLSVLDEELQRLPERYRAPLVQCYLQGATCDEAARSIGWPLRTLKRRLEQGRNRLRTRLANRGLALSAALLAAGLTHGATVSLPARLIDMTARAAIQAAGVASASAVTLAQGVLSAMLTARLKLVAAVLLLAGLITVGAGALAQSTGASAQADPTVAARQVPLPAVLQKKMESGGDKELIAAGRVLGTDGKPLPGAEVALVGRWRRTDTQKPDTEVLARGKTDEQGRFRLVRKGAAPQQLYDLHLFAGGKDAGIVWRDLRRSPGKDALELKLEPEQSLRGRMFDLQGVPAKGVKGRIVYAARKFNPASKDAANRERMYASMYVRALGGGVTPTRSPGGVEFRLTELPAGLALWPQPLTTDAEGRFEIRGFAANHEVHLLIDDDRFALQELQIETATKPQPKEISLSLAPSRRIEGRIICEDTGKPMAGVELVVSAFRGANGRDAFARTDAQGRYSVNPYPGDTFTIRAWPPTGEPYVGVEQQLTWTKGAARQTLDFNLPRGVTVKGQVVEAPAGKALARVRVFYLPRVEGNPQLRRGLLVGSYWPARSAADGTFRLVVPVGPGHLLVNADNPETGADDPDLVTRVVSLGELRGGKADGTLRYYHEVLPVNFQIKDDPKNL
ncbi:MAG TPA: sigma-70 family RNA polymerase sigma factor, partial [Gemmataceae bacterium]|nr:sigma-70 family RNA polymerase sigma factor [Gemmataceae bacterium]